MSLKPRDPNLTSEQQKILDDFWSTYSYGYTESFKSEMEDVYYHLWGKTKPNPNILPNSMPTSTPVANVFTSPTPAPAPSISDQLQLGMNALWQGKEPPPPPVLPNSGPNFMASTPILDTIPTFNTREELMTNYKVADNAWTGDLAPKKSILEDVANAFDPKKNGVADAFDPQKNGVADAFDPKKNGVADFFNPPQEEEKDNSSMNLILLGAGALILVYALMG